ncbi:sugar-binding transcriptional regulator [Nakamurella flavida]
MVKAPPAPSARRLIATVAWLYHTRGLRQNAIAERLNISQSRVSRLLEQAVGLDIVRTTVVLPADEQSVLERELETAYDLRSAHVYDIGEVLDETQLVRELGQLLALQLQTTPLDAEVIGFTPWSRTLQEAVRNLQPLRNSGTRYVVEMLGDLGPPAQQHLAAQNTQQLATLTGGEPLYLRLPGVLPNREVKETLLAHDSHARETLAKLDSIDLALTGFGSGDIVPPLRAGDNFFTADQVARVKKLGAVGEVNLRYICEDGTPVANELDELVVGATLAQLRRAERRLGVGGGPSKYAAVRAALLGGWINVLVTDSTTAQWLLDNRTR